MSRLMSGIGPIVLIGALLCGGAAAQSGAVEREIFPPAQGRGAAVVVISGASGTPLFRGFSSDLAKSGYYTVLIKGYDVIPNWNVVDPQGLANLRAAIADALSAPNATAGKAAVVGLSMGGAGALLHGSALKEQVSAIVAFYPALTRLATDMKPLAAGLQVPMLVLAGEKDTYAGCCMIESARALDAAPKTAPFELVVYPNAGHGFNLPNDSRFVYRAEDAADSWARTMAFLKRFHPPGGDSPR